MKRRPRSSGRPRELTVDVESLGFLGDGQAKVDDRTVLIRGAMPGERWRIQLAPARGHAWRAEPLEALTRAAERQTAPCRHFGRCGGCALQHLPAGTYDDLKRQRVVNALQHRGIALPDLEPTAVSPLASRRRLRLAFDRGGALGLREAGGRAVVAMRECVIADPRIVDALPSLRRIARVLKSNGEIAVTATSSGLDIGFTGVPSISLEQCERIAGEAADARWARVSVRTTIDDHPQILAQQTAPVIEVAHTKIELPAGSFLQATRAGEAALQAFAIAALDGFRQIADLFCGVGTLGLALSADDRRIAGYDSDPAAIAALRATNRLAHVEARDLFNDPLSAKELGRFDAIMIDPPRSGATAQCEALAASSVREVIYASCDPASFACDAAMLCGAGFQLRRLQPVDQFLFSAEIELIADFQRV